MLRTTTVITGVNGTPWYSTLHFGGSTLGEAAAAGAATAAFWNGYDTFMVTPLLWSVNTDIPSIDPATGNILEMFTWEGADGNGAGSGEALPYSNQALIQWRTGVYVGGREVRGRTFLPGLSEADNGDGIVAQGTRTALLGYANALATAASPAGELVVWSPTQGVTAEVTSVNVPQLWAILRTRRD